MHSFACGVRSLAVFEILIDLLGYVGSGIHIDLLPECFHLVAEPSPPIDLIRSAVLRSHAASKASLIHPPSFSPVRPSVSEVYNARDRHTAHAVLPCDF